ncbi:MAG: hypothetical protein AAGJ46_01210 [Planctomycetota bacterium]
MSRQDAKAATLLAVAFLLPVALWMWLAMMLVHELGHVVGAEVTGGVVTHVNVYPGRLSSTLVRPNPMPGVVLWAGIVGGWLVPAALALGCRWLPATVRAVADCWAAFCLLAGGVYLAIGGTERLTDTGQLVAAGWRLPLLIAIGSLAALAGYAWSRHAWTRLLGEINRRSITLAHAASAWAMLIAWIAGQWLLADQLASVHNVR